MREKEAAQWKEKVLLVHHEQRLHSIHLLLSKYVIIKNESMNMQAFCTRIRRACFSVNKFTVKETFVALPLAS